VVAPLEMKEGTPLGARAQSAIQRAAVLYKPRLATFNFFHCVSAYCVMMEWKFNHYLIIISRIFNSKGLKPL
jgi:hypothetical protein